MRTLRGQLVLSHILPFLLVLPLITIALLYLVETQVLLANLSQRATERATLIGEAIQRQVEVLGSPAEAQAFVADLTVSLDGRVLLLTPDGRFLAAGGQGSDSATQPLQTAGFSQRDGWEAVEIARRQEPELMICDLAFGLRTPRFGSVAQGLEFPVLRGAALAEVVEGAHANQRLHFLVERLDAQEEIGWRGK